MGNLGKIVDDDKDGIIALLRPRKTGNKVHLNVVPLPLRNFYWLKQPCWLLVLCLHSSAHITLGDKTGNIPLHTSPPETLLEVLIHLGATRVDGQLRIMCLLHDDLSQVSLLRNHSSVFEHHCAIAVD